MYISFRFYVCWLCFLHSNSVQIVIRGVCTSFWRLRLEIELPDLVRWRETEKKGTAAKARAFGCLGVSSVQGANQISYLTWMKNKVKHCQYFNFQKEILLNFPGWKEYYARNQEINDESRSHQHSVYPSSGNTCNRTRNNQAKEDIVSPSHPSRIDSNILDW